MLQLGKVFQSKMVMQREKEICIWGSGVPGERVTAQIQGQKNTCQVQQDGTFLVKLGPLAASEEEKLVVTTAKEQVVLEEIAVGEVWIAGGQSNMEFQMRYEKHFSSEKGGNKRLRFFDVPEVAYEGQEEDFDYSTAGIWRSAEGKELEYFSAVGYYFQKELEANLDVCVGIIGCNWGGTRAAAWMNPETVKVAGKPWMDLYRKQTEGLNMKEFYQKQKENPMNDRGDLLGDPFTEMMLPRTPSQEEIAAFFAQAGEDVSEYVEALKPHAIPGNLYEHMVKTIAGFPVRGVLWYQGESDDEEEGLQSFYRKMLEALIGDWRELWKEELPFLIVQLPGWESWLGNGNNDFPTIREGQRLVTEEVKNTYLCSISDAGEQFDIHPKNKKVVGERLAKLARGHIYGENILCDPPALHEGYLENGVIHLVFAHGGEMKVEGHQIHALDLTVGGQQIPYTFQVEKNKVKLTPQRWEDGTITVSFAQGKWYQVNLFNSANIPAIPFEITLRKKEDM